MSKNFEDLTGRKFGRLTVVGRGEDYINPKGKRRPRWICQCECGGTSLTQTPALKNGKATSCGCKRRELAQEKIREMNKGNILDIIGE